VMGSPTTLSSRLRCGESSGLRGLNGVGAGFVHGLAGGDVGSYLSSERVRKVTSVISAATSVRATETTATPVTTRWVRQRASGA